MKLHDGELCRGLLEDAAKREEILRRDRNLALNDLREVRDQLTHAYHARDVERAGRERAEKDRDRLDHEIAALKADLSEATARCAELENRARLSLGSLPCGGCGGPHLFDTSINSVVWNQVIRARGLSEFLCASCVIRAFVLAERSFNATLWGDGLPAGVPIEIRIRSHNANEAARVGEENTALRAEIAELRARLARPLIPDGDNWGRIS